MTTRTFTADRRWSLSLVVTLCVGLLLSGCQQFVVLGYLLGGPPTIEPDFDAETGKSMTKPGVKVAIVCFAPRELQLEFPSIDKEIAAQVAFRMSEHNITIIRPDYVRAWIDEHPDWELAEEIGKEFKADFVVEVELDSFGLYEGDSTSLFRGRTECYVNVIEMDEAKETGDRIFSKEIDFAFPTAIPRSTYEQTQLAFKREYLSRLSEKIGWLFFERFNGDTIPWAT